MRKWLNTFLEFFYFDFFKKFIALQTFKYLICGSTTAFADLFSYNIAYYYWFKKMPVIVMHTTIAAHIAAFIVSFCIAFPLGFIFNKYIVFTTSELRGWHQLFRYGLSVMTSLGLSYVFLKICIEVLGIEPTLSKFITTVLIAINSYFMQQYFTFKVKTIS